MSIITLQLATKSYNADMSRILTGQKAVHFTKNNNAKIVEDKKIN